MTQTGVPRAHAKTLTATERRHFQRTVYTYFEQHGRHQLPWRLTHDPYAILASEIMLQQTQVPRVIPKYEQWLKELPTIQALATAPVSQVLKLWQGLGYNRRALNLKRCAEAVVREHHGALPTTEVALKALPGIGPYTAAAVAAFAFNQPTVMIETNIRAVYIHHFFPQQERVADEKLLPLITATLDHTQPRTWYSALMDYGTYLKSLHGNPSRRSRHYSKQSPLKGSNREVRGAILKVLAEHTTLTATQLQKQLPFTTERTKRALAELITEGFVSRRQHRLALSP